MYGKLTQSKIVINKINSFKDLREGWHYGEGLSIKVNVINMAIELCDYIFEVAREWKKKIKLNAFPGINSEVQLSLVIKNNRHLEFMVGADHYIDITIADDYIEFIYEKGKEEIISEEDEYLKGMSFEDVKIKIRNFMEGIWKENQLPIPLL